MKNKFKILCVVAARPNFMKIAPILGELDKQKCFMPVLVHTGQHYDVNMSDVFFRDLGIREPDVHLGIGSGSHAEQTGRLMIEFEQLCMAQKPDMVLVVGDVNATVACSLVAAKLHVPVAHVEAGLRSGDRRMPEEINRIVTDQLSDLLFTTCSEADENLVREGVAREKIHFVGNVMVDSLLTNLSRTNPDAVVKRLLGDIDDQEFAVLTMHRPSNVDDTHSLLGWIEAFELLSERLLIVCPIHPRTRNSLQKFDLMNRFESAVKVTEPLSYLEFIGLMQRSTLLITDSGGIQEEATMLHIPCFTIRENTERPVTITNGSNRLVGIQPADLVEHVSMFLTNKPFEDNKVPELWDGAAAARVCRILVEYFSGSRD